MLAVLSAEWVLRFRDVPTPEPTIPPSALRSPYVCHDGPSVDASLDLSICAGALEGEKCLVDCETGLEPNVPFAECRNGAWTPAKCMLPDCVGTPAIEHGKVVHGKAVCDEGFAEVGELRCIAGQWSVTGRQCAARRPF